MVSADLPPWPVERLLRELLAERLLSVEELERRLGWGSGRLADLLTGRRAVAFAEVLPILATLDRRPVELFSRLYGWVPKDLGLAPRPLDARFEESLRAVREAMRRRSARTRSGGEMD